MEKDERQVRLDRIWSRVLGVSDVSISRDPVCGAFIQSDEFHRTLRAREVVMPHNRELDLEVELEEGFYDLDMVAYFWMGEKEDHVLALPTWFVRPKVLGDITKNKDRIPKKYWRNGRLWLPYDKVQYQPLKMRPSRILHNDS